MFLVLASVGCQSTPASKGADQSDYLMIELSEWVPQPGSPSGWVYAFDRGDLVDLCVYAWPDGRWMLGAETRPGYCGTEIASGLIVDGRAVGFPVGLLESSANLYVSGHMKASLDGQAIPRGQRDEVSNAKVPSVSAPQRP